MIDEGTAQRIMGRVADDLQNHEDWLHHREDQIRARIAKRFETQGPANLLNTRAIFNCTRCGNCCQHFQRQQPDQRNRVWLTRLSCTPPLVLLLPEGTYHPSLYPWEVMPLHELAQTHHVTLEVRPYAGFASRKLRTFFITHYAIGNSRCPFLLKDTGCAIYTQRPMVCECTPLIDTGLFTHRTRFDFRCGGIVSPLDLEQGTLVNGRHARFSLDIRDTFEAYYHGYGETYLNQVKRELIDLAFLHAIQFLQEQQVIAFSAPPAYGTHMFRHYQRVNLLGYLQAYHRDLYTELDMVHTAQHYTRMSISELEHWLAFQYLRANQLL